MCGVFDDGVTGRQDPLLDYSGRRIGRRVCCRRRRDHQVAIRFGGGKPAHVFWLAQVVEQGGGVGGVAVDEAPLFVEGNAFARRVGGSGESSRDDEEEQAADSRLAHNGNEIHRAIETVFQRLTNSECRFCLEVSWKFFVAARNKRRDASEAGKNQVCESAKAVWLNWRSGVVRDLI